MGQSRYVRLKISDRALRNLKHYSKRRGTNLSRTADRLFGILNPNRYPEAPAVYPGGVPALTPVQVRAVRDRINSGQNFRTVAKALGVSLATIQRAYHGQYCYGRYQFKSPAPLSVPQCEVIRAEYQAGQSYRAIAREFKVSDQTVRRCVKRIGAYAYR